MPGRRIRPPLSEAQLELMKILWESGGGTVADVLERVQLRRPVGRTTVQTMLSRLADKGWLVQRDEGGAFVYTPAVPREEVQDQVLRQFVDTMFDGSAAGILMALLRDRSLSREEAARIRRMIKDAEDRR
ncbi:BlaI/MecI/CopY family transcriptional regulator [Tundrisphaera lichenicola]|uniref:BlaI/MecI/CopY family transcriptional regulator n=1 Tax=Tundrisphaera lichenicola TaxID=2029860 RepID=UPI003EB70601